MTLRVLLADGHTPTREGIRVALEEHGLSVCAQADTRRAAVLAALEHRPDVCLLDVSLAGDGIATAQEIRAALPETYVVMLTASERDDDLFAALRAGAAGYLVKDTDPARLGFTVEGLVNGEAALPRRLVTRLIEEFCEPRRRRVLRAVRASGVELTDREWEVLELMRHGLTTKAIARELDVVDVTVRRHLSGALTKLNAPDRDTALKRLDEIAP